jgi:hypothetical protein
MIRIDRLRFALWLAAAWTLLAAVPALAQTCAAPTQILFTGWRVGDTCNNTQNLPYLANGAIVNNGEDDVYHVAIGSLVTSWGEVTLSPLADVDLTLFICHGPCGAYATCLSVADAAAGSSATVYIPPVAGDYYIIVGHAGLTGATCGSYELSVSYPFND